MNEPSDINWDEVKANLDICPWVVWEITVRDPGEVLRNADVAEVTRAAATEAANLFGCVYEYCVDDDYLPDGTKYYQWCIGVKQSEHRQLVGRKGSEPTVVIELFAALLSVLPKEFNNSNLWTRGQPVPDLRPNEIDNRYTAGEIESGTTDIRRS